jgi:hypothetical protein
MGYNDCRSMTLRIKHPLVYYSDTWKVMKGCLAIEILV